MSKSVVVTARIADALAADLDLLAARRDRSKAWLIEKAIASFVHDELTLLAEVEAADAEIDRGEGLAHDAFMAELRAEFGGRRAA